LLDHSSLAVSLSLAQNFSVVLGESDCKAYRTISWTFDMSDLTDVQTAYQLYCGQSLCEDRVEGLQCDSRCSVRMELQRRRAKLVEGRSWWCMMIVDYAGGGHV